MIRVRPICYPLLNLVEVECFRSSKIANHINLPPRCDGIWIFGEAQSLLVRTCAIDELGAKNPKGRARFTRPLASDPQNSLPTNAGGPDEVGYFVVDARKGVHVYETFPNKRCHVSM
jgi:hypothetical protein